MHIMFKPTQWTKGVALFASRTTFGFCVFDRLDTQGQISSDDYLFWSYYRGKFGFVRPTR